jgi:hypothetical protein
MRSVVYYKGDDSQLAICVCYLWAMALKVGLDAFFDKVYDWKE